MILLGCILSICGVGLLISVHNIVKDKISEIQSRQQRLQIQNVNFTSTNRENAINVTASNRLCNNTIGSISIPILIDNIANSFLYKLNDEEINDTSILTQFSEQEILLALQFCSRRGEIYGFSLATINSCVGPILLALKAGMHLYQKDCDVQNVMLNFSRNSSESYKSNTPIDGTSFQSLSVLFSNTDTIICSIPQSSSNISGIGLESSVLDINSADLSTQCFLHYSYPALVDVSVSSVELFPPVFNHKAETLNNNSQWDNVDQDGNLTTLPSSRSHEMYLEINDVTYVFEYVDGWDPYKAANTLALHFCSEKGVMLLNLNSSIEPLQDVITGNESNESAAMSPSELLNSRLHEDCVVPIRLALQEKIQSLI